MAQIASDLENNHTGRKLSTMAIRLGLLIEIFLIQLSSSAFYRDCHTNPYIFVSHAHTELGGTFGFIKHQTLVNSFVNLNINYKYLNTSNKDTNMSKQRCIKRLNQMEILIFE